MVRKKKSISKRKSIPAAKSRLKKSKPLAVKKPRLKIKKTLTKRKAKVSAIPKGYHNVTPYLVVEGASEAINFYKSTFGAKQVFRMDKPDGKVGHAELKIGDAKIMLADKCPEMEKMVGEDYGSGAISIHLYVKNVDTTIEKAVSGGAKIIMPAQDMFYGDRNGMIKDPFGHIWSVATHIEDVTPAKIKKRAVEFYGKK
jgi:PhnB protein